MHPTNALSPDRMTSAQRIVEIAELLSKAFIRLSSDEQKTSTISDSERQFLLDKSARQSVHRASENTIQQEV